MDTQPGHSKLCRGCQHHDAVMHRQGHPSPCNRVRWIGAHHVKPQLRVANGKVDCSDFYNCRNGSGTERVGE